VREPHSDSTCPHFAEKVRLAKAAQGVATPPAKTPAKAAKGRVKKTQEALAKSSGEKEKQKKEEEEEEEEEEESTTDSERSSDEETTSAESESEAHTDDDRSDARSDRSRRGGNKAERRRFSSNRHRFLRAVNAKTADEQADLLMFAVGAFVDRVFRDRTHAEKKRAKRARKEGGGSAKKRKKDSK